MFMCADRQTSSGQFSAKCFLWHCPFPINGCSGNNFALTCPLEGLLQVKGMVAGQHEVYKKKPMVATKHYNIFDSLFIFTFIG